MLQGQRDLTTVGRMILSDLAPVVGAQQGVLCVLDGSKGAPELALLAGYADEGQVAVGGRLGLGQGLVGQCALDKQKVLLNNAPPDYVRISSALGSAVPKSIIVLPIIFEGQVKGVLELASLDRFSSTHQAFLDQLTESIGIVIHTIEANMRTEGLLKQSQSLAHELQSRGEELQKTNEELQEKARLLAHQNEEVERKNQEVEQARQALEEKAKQLALTSKYKSEFLANMSHELRTPLNSLLILSDQLSKNSDGNLTNKQTEFAKTIHSSGNDLLMLINDILDLSKIESGTVMVDASDLRLDDLRGYVERTFRHVAEAKTVGFRIEMDSRLPGSMYTDSKRLQQVLKNLLSNAFKFTHHGQVSLSVAPVSSGWSSDNSELTRATSVLAFSVSDTGIGISPDKQQIIFEAFQQADGSTSRKYGGTGLGLAISRELSRLLGGEIRLTSAPNRGSTFTLYLPQTYSARTVRRATADGLSSPAIETTPVARMANVAAAPRVVAAIEAEPIEEMPLVNEAGDDRDIIQSGDRIILIVENDIAFARVLLDSARETGFKGLVTSLGASALGLAREFNPHAITLDIFLPDMEGWRVLDRLKNDLATRHVPICVISTDDSRQRALNSGAKYFVPKPLQTREPIERLLRAMNEFLGRDERRMLVMDACVERRQGIVDYLADESVRVIGVATLSEVMDHMRREQIDCLVVGPDALDFDSNSIADVLGESPIASALPIIVFGEGDEPSADGERWKSLSEFAVVRRAQSPERLLDHANRFLHRPMTRLPERKRVVLEDLHQSNKSLARKKVLIVDDDMRNIFALSTVLEEHQMEIMSAVNGRDAIKTLREDPDMDVVLMDIMMPDMDGFETMRVIRKIPELRGLPIIAVTAKAMKGDRERCIEAGAWDYLSKPVDPEQMLAVLRGWLHR
jgi:signal transduction histidine kinase/DNA-binding response OmpR family regulator